MFEIIHTCTWEVEKVKSIPAKTANNAEIGIGLPYGRRYWGWLLICVVGARYNDFIVRRIHSTVSGDVFKYSRGI